MRLYQHLTLTTLASVFRRQLQPSCCLPVQSSKAIIAPPFLQRQPKTFQPLQNRKYCPSHQVLILWTTLATRLLHLFYVGVEDTTLLKARAISWALTKVCSNTTRTVDAKKTVLLIKWRTSICVVVAEKLNIAKTIILMTSLSNPEPSVLPSSARRCTQMISSTQAVKASPQEPNLRCESL